MAEPTYDEQGRPQMPTTGTEAETLKGFLDFQRATLAWKVRGLTDEQLTFQLPTSALSLGGMLMHLARVEDYWFSETVAEGGPVEPWASMMWAAEWQDAAAKTGEELRRLWEQRCRASREVVATRSLEDVVPAWGGQGRVSLRWVLTHMVEEYARHNGHADLLREAIDGETGE